MSLKINLPLIRMCLIMLIASVATYANNQQLRSTEIPESLTHTQWLEIKQQIEQTQEEKMLNQTIEQQAYVKASNTDAGDSFGFSVAISGDTLVVGTYLESSNATGINGDEKDNSAFAAGAVYVYVNISGIWSQQAYLKASNTDAMDSFGWSVAISGDIIVVGAPVEGSRTSGIDGDENNNLLPESGAVYVFTRTLDDWTQQAFIKASNPDENDNFGASLAVSGDTIVVGATSEGSSSTGVNGDENNNLSLYSGAAYVFTRTVDIWSQQAYIKASNTDGFDFFGEAVAIDGDTFIVSASLEDSNATGVNNNQLDNSLNSTGAVYVFVRNAGLWTQQAYLKASNTDSNDKFGRSIGIYKDDIVVGALNEDSDSTGINGDENNNLAIHSGAAYVFKRTGDIWSQEAYIKASNSEARDSFGRTVAISDRSLVVGAYREDSKATGIDAAQSNNLADNSGAAYMFTKEGNIWQQNTYIKASNTQTDDQFGFSVALSGNSLVIAASREDSNSTGVNGDQQNDAMESSGAVYYFDDVTELIFKNGFE